MVLSSAKRSFYCTYLRCVDGVTYYKPSTAFAFPVAILLLNGVAQPFG
jgi:hypothetical protein